MVRWSVAVSSHRTDLATAATAAAVASGNACLSAVESNLSLLVLWRAGEPLSYTKPITEQKTTTTTTTKNVAMAAAASKGGRGRRGTRDAGLMTRGGDTRHPSLRNGRKRFTSWGYYTHAECRRRNDAGTAAIDVQCCTALSQSDGIARYTRGLIISCCLNLH